MRPLQLMAGLATLMSSTLLAAPSADLILTNVEIYGHKGADSIAVSEGKIVYIGQQTGALAYQGDTTELIDLEQAYLLPGFIDNHNHVFEAASPIGGDCELNPAAGLEQLASELEACRGLQAGNRWLTGYGFSIDAVLASENKRTPLDVIDAIFPKQPVVLMEQSSHSMWVNSAALQLAGIDRSTADPQGGRILRDERSGELNGILLDNAGDRVMEIAWNSVADLFEQNYEGLMIGLEQAAANGITTIGDGRLYWKRGWYEVWKQAEADGALSARVSLRPWIYPDEPIAPQLKFMQSIQSDDLSKRLLVNQAKLYSDGIIINGTAKVLAPYLDTYLPDAPYGLNYIPPQQLKDWLRALDQIGYSAHIHAIGDGGTRESLNAIEAVRGQGAQRPYTLTHVELVDSADLPRFKQLNVTADFQVGWEYVAEHDHAWAKPFLGAERAGRMMDLKAIYDTGANLSLSSDWNVHELSPLVGIANSLKMGPTGLPDIHAAIAAYTRNAAVSLGIEEVTGTLEVGKSADFVLLDSNITELPIDEIPQAEVLMTVLQGEIVFDRDE